MAVTVNGKHYFSSPLAHEAVRQKISRNLLVIQIFNVTHAKIIFKGDAKVASMHPHQPTSHQFQGRCLAPAASAEPSFRHMGAIGQFA